jgi:hypothetical protein
VAAMRHRVRQVVVVSALALAAGLLTLALLATMTLFGSDSAEAIPPPQARCAFGFIQTNSSNAAQPISGLSVTVNNGTAARTAIVQLSADTGVDTNAEVRVSYSVDGGPPQEDTFGPANLANHQEFFEARAVIAVIPLSAGTHTITPHWRVSGIAGKQAFMDSRCMTVESRTR